MRRLKRQMALALLAVGAVMTLTIAPASATFVTYDYQITDGMITVDDSIIDPIDLGEGPEEDPCDLGWDPPSGRIDIRHDGTPPDVTADTDILSFDIGDVTGHVVSWASDWYYVEFDLFGFSDTTGEVDSSDVWTQSVGIVMTITNIGVDGMGDPETCDPEEGTNPCDFVFDFGTFVTNPLTGAITSHGATTLGELSGTTTALSSACQDPFLQQGLLNKTVNLEVDVSITEKET